MICGWLICLPKFNDLGSDEISVTVPGPRRVRGGLRASETWNKRFSTTQFTSRSARRLPHVGVSSRSSSMGSRSVEETRDNQANQVALEVEAEFANMDHLSPRINTNRLKLPFAEYRNFRKNDTVNIAGQEIQAKSAEAELTIDVGLISTPTQLKSAMKHGSSPPGMSGFRAANVVLTGPVSLTTQLTSGAPRQSFWEAAHESEASEDGVAVYVGSSSNKAKSYVMYSRHGNESVVTTVPPSKDRKHILSRLNTPGPACPPPTLMTKVQLSPSVIVYKPRKFVKERKTPVICPTGSVSSFVQVPDIKFGARLIKTAGVTEPRIVDIITEIETNLHEGLPIGIIENGVIIPATLYLKPNEDLVMEVDHSSNRTEIIVSLRSLIDVSVWMNLVHSPELQMQMSDDIFATLPKSILKNLVVLQYLEFGMYARSCWLVTPQAVALKLYCEAVKTLCEVL